MYSFVFITHGELGKTLLDIASRIMDIDVADRTAFFSIEFSMAMELDGMKANLEKTIDSFLEKGKKVIILVDLFGGSPSNIALSLAKKEGVDVISGVNLSMVMYSLEHRDDETDLETMVDGIIRSARQNITGAKQLLKKRESK
jgi:Phosphotransferase system, mannose/fructose-specific component IIA